MFPAPYKTEGIRLTNATDCGGADCVLSVGYSYWRNTNNHRDSDTMLIFLGLRGVGPTLFSYSKSTEQVKKLGPLFEASSPLARHSGEGWYFSASQPTKLYVNGAISPQLQRYDVLARTFETVFDATAQFGGDRYIWQTHSSDDDNVHSATLRDLPSHAKLGCLAYREHGRQFFYYAALDDFGECQIDKSGRWLLIKEDLDGLPGRDNLVVDLETGAEKILLDPNGAGGYSDNGYGYMVAADTWNSASGAVRVWDFDQSPLRGPLVYRTTFTDARSVGPIAHSNARPGVPLSRQYACAANTITATVPRANEIVCFRLDGSLDVLVVTQNMTDLSARRGGDRDPKLPMGNLDVTGEYFIWVSNMGGNRADAFMVKVPARLLMDARPHAPPPADSDAEAAPGSRLTGLTASPHAADDRSLPDPTPLPVVTADASLIVANGSVLTLAPQDTFINLDATNRSTNARLVTYTWPDNKVANAILMKFDLSAISPAAVVTDATLQLALLDSDTAPESTYTVAAHKVVGKNPLITAATGYTADGVTPWTPNTCCFNNVPLAQADISAAYDARAIDKTPGYKSWSITAMVQEWVANPTTNFGLLLNSDASKLRDRYRTFASTEHATASVRPYLRVTYSLVPDVTPPLISAVLASAITSSGAAISWTTNEPSDSQVEYGTTTAYGSPSALNASLVIAHVATLGGLAPNTLYHYRVRSRDFAGNLAVSGDSTFTTLALDLTPPTVSITAPTAGATVVGTVPVTADATDNVGVVGVQFKLDGANLGAEDTTSPYSASWNTVSGANGSHTLTAVARDGAGNTKTSAGVAVTVNNPAGPAWPNEPSGFTAIEETGWESGTLGNWYKIFTSADKPITVTNVPDSLIGESKALEIGYAVGHVGGGGTELRYDIPAALQSNELFVGYYVQVNPLWQGHSSAINKMLYMYDGGDIWSAMWYEMFGSGSSPLGLYVVNQSGDAPPGFHENVTPITFVRGVWHKVEIYQKQGASNNGIVRVWVNGVLAIDRSDVDTISAPINNITISGIWGGLADSKNQADYMRFDRIRISRPGSAPAPLFSEGFEDASLAARGWYDNTTPLLSPTQHVAGSVSSIEYKFLAGATSPTAASTLRRKFAPTDSVYLSYYVKYGTNWVGSQRPYHPHEFHFLTNLNGDWSGLSFTRLTAYVEQNGGFPLLAIQDGENVDQANIGVNLTAVTENRGVAGCNGSSDGYPDNCYLGGGVYVNEKKWKAATQYFTDTAGPFYKNDWHFIEAYFKLNSISGGKGVNDGVIRYWFDGQPVIDRSNVLLRTGANPTMKFNQLVIAPYIGDGSPVTQSMWIDNLTVATARP